MVPFGGCTENRKTSMSYGGNGHYRDKSKLHLDKLESRGTYSKLEFNNTHRLIEWGSGAVATPNVFHVRASPSLWVQVSRKKNGFYTART